MEFKNEHETRLFHIFLILIIWRQFYAVILKIIYTKQNIHWTIILVISCWYPKSLDFRILVFWIRVGKTCTLLDTHCCWLSRIQSPFFWWSHQIFFLNHLILPESHSWLRSIACHLVSSQPGHCNPLGSNGWLIIIMWQAEPTWGERTLLRGFWEGDSGLPAGLWRWEVSTTLT